MSSLLTGLTAYYALDEASGTRADRAGGNDLANNGGVGSAAGKVGDAASFAPASSQYLSHADAPGLQAGPGSFSLACWLRPTAAALAGVGAPVGKYQTGFDREYALQYVNGLGLRFLASAAGGDTTDLVASADFTADTWAFVVAWHDHGAGTNNIQVNGGAVDTTAFAGPIYSASGQGFAIGRLSATNSQYWDGLVDEVGLWQRLLSSGERAALYNGGAGTTYPF